MTTETITKTDEVKTDVVKTDTVVGSEVKTDEVKTDQPDWRQTIATTRAKGDEAQAAKIVKKLERFPDPGVLYDSFEETQQALRDSGRIKHPGKDATPEEIAAFNKALGVPEKNDGYKIKLPVDVELDDGDKATLKKLTERFHGRGGLSAHPDVVQAVTDAYLELREDSQATLVANGAKLKSDAETSLKKEWGSDYAKNVAFTGPGLTALVGVDNAEGLRTVRLEGGGFLGDHPLFVKALAQAGRMAGQDPILWAASQSQGDPKTLETEKSEIMAWRSGSGAERQKYAEASKPGGRLAIINAQLAGLKKNKAA